MAIKKVFFREAELILTPKMLVLFTDIFK